MVSDDIFPGTEPGMSGTAESFLGLAHGRTEVTPGGQANEERIIRVIREEAGIKSILS